jgi:hypothetical protein
MLSEKRHQSNDPWKMNRRMVLGFLKLEALKVLREKEAKQRRAPVDSERDRRSDLRIFLRRSRHQWAAEHLGMAYEVASRLLTCCTRHGLPAYVVRPRRFSSAAIFRRDIPSPISRITFGSMAARNAATLADRAECMWRVSRSGRPSLTPRALAAASAALVRGGRVAGEQRTDISAPSQAF